MPWMLLNRSEIYEMQQRSGSGENGVVEFATLPVGKPGCLDKRGSGFQILLEKHRGIYASRPALKYGRPVLEERHYVRTDLKVITKQLKFRNLFIGPIDSLETGQ